MDSINIIMAGFGRYRRRRKNLTVVLVLVFFLIFFFLTFFSRLDGNLKTYWDRMLLGGDYIVSNAEKYVDIMMPVDPEHYFLKGDFFAENPRMNDIATPRLRIGVMAESEDSGDNFEHLFILAGVDTVRERALLGNIRVNNGGHYFSGKPDEIIMPQSIANDLGVKVGDRVILAAQTVDGFLDMAAVTVIGIQEVSATAFIFGAYVAYVPIELVQNLTGTDKISEMVIARRGGLQHSQSVRGGYRYVPSLECFSAARAVSIAYFLLRWVIVLFIGVFAFGIIYQNIMTMNEERRGEIAIYLTYGASPMWLARLLYAELILYSLYCSAIGTLAGFVLMGGLTLAGLYPVDSVTEIMMGGTRLILLPGFSEFIGAVLILLALVLSSAFLPVQRGVSNKNIVKMFTR